MSRRKKEKETDNPHHYSHLAEPSADIRPQPTNRHNETAERVFEGKKGFKLPEFTVCVGYTLISMVTLGTDIDIKRESAETTKWGESATVKDVFAYEDDDDSPILSKEDKPRERGRPAIRQLCSMFSNDAVWMMTKTIFRRIFKTSIQQTSDLAKYLVCFLCGLFRYLAIEEPFGRVACYYRLMSQHFSSSMMPRLRTLQTGLQWLMDKKKTYFRCADSQKEEKKHRIWEKLAELIYGHLVELAPQYSKI